MTSPTSKAWNYFKRTANSKTVKCKLCETELTYTGGTTNMLNHLRLKHNTGIEHENTPQKQPYMAEFVRSPRSRHLSGTKAEEITRAIAIKTFTQINLKPHEFLRKPWIKFHAWRWAPCIVHKCGKTSIDTSNRVLDRKKYRLTG